MIPYIPYFPSQERTESTESTEQVTFIEVLVGLFSFMFIIFVIIFCSSCFFNWSLGNGATNGYYFLKSKILPAQVECQVKNVNGGGYYDLLVVNQATNEGTLYKGFSNEYDVNEAVSNLPEGSYSLYLNHRLSTLNSNYEKTIFNTYYHTSLINASSEWKEFISVNLTPDLTALDYLMRSPKDGVFCYTYSSHSVE